MIHFLNYLVEDSRAYSTTSEHKTVSGYQEITLHSNVIYTSRHNSVSGHKLRCSAELHGHVVGLVAQFHLVDGEQGGVG